MSKFVESFLGFTFNNIHSSELGIVRTIESRMDLQLRPESKDIALDLPGMDGQYWFGTNYTKRIFNINFAFGALSEQQLNRLKILLCDKKIHELIFDEAPYKAYSAKATGVSTIKHLCFDELDGARVYRGEGTIQFVCNYPFARSLYRSLEEARTNDVFAIITHATTEQINSEKYSIIKLAKSGELAGKIYNIEEALRELHINNIAEWENSSNLPKVFDYTNHGDLPMSFCVRVNNLSLSGTSFIIRDKDSPTSLFSAFLKAEKSTDGKGYAIINMKDNMIYEYSGEGKKLGILNHQINDGNFFEISPKAGIDIQTGKLEEFRYIYY